MVKLGALNKKLVRELGHLKTQVFSISVVMAIGISMLFGFSSTYKSLEKSRDDFYQSSGFSNVFLNAKKAPDLLAKQLESIKGVKQVESRLEYEALISLPKFQEPAVGRFISIPDGRQPKMNRIHLTRGRIPQATANNEVVVTPGFFKAHELSLGDLFSATLNGRLRKLKVVGVGVSPEHIISIQAGLPFPDDLHFTVVWINQTALEATYDMRSSFNSAVIETNPNINELEVIAKIDQKMDPFGGHGAYGREKQVSYFFVKEELNQLKTHALMIPVIFFLVAAYILNVVISRMVRAQRGEIATLKALGYLDSEVASYYFKVTSVIVFFGAVIGLGLGHWLGRAMIDLYGDFYRFPTLKYDFTYLELLLSIVVSLMVALAGAYFSLRHIFQMQPAEAMRPPSPPSYQKAFLESQAWFRQMQIRTRMNLRSMVNFPVKTTLTGLGMCFSVVILVSGLFWQDCLDFLILAQYSFVQKESGRIQLTHDVSPRAVKEVESLQGIVEAEGYRQSVVKVKFGTREETTSIKGFPDQARLQGLVDEDLRDIALSKSQIFISRILSDQLKVGEGDTIDIEFTEGREPKFQLKISRIVDSLMSNELITSRRTLAQMLKSDDLVNQILFRSLQDTSVLYTKLKSMPNILSISYKDSALEFFEQNSARFIGVIAVIISIFAGAIGFGVAFNSLRVALAETDWELATLRILGFTTPEVFFILFSEILILLILFLPVGWVLGYWNGRVLLNMMSVEAFQIPFIIDPMTYAWATLILFASVSVSAFFIFRLVARLDLVATLKSRG